MMIREPAKRIDGPYRRRHETEAVMAGACAVLLGMIVLAMLFAG